MDIETPLAIMNLPISLNSFPLAPCLLSVCPLFSLTRLNPPSPGPPTHPSYLPHFQTPPLPSLPPTTDFALHCIRRCAEAAFLTATSCSPSCQAQDHFLRHFLVCGPLPPLLPSSPVSVNSALTHLFSSTLAFLAIQPMVIWVYPLNNDNFSHSLLSNFFPLLWLFPRDCIHFPFLQQPLHIFYLTYAFRSGVNK